ncbi:uncharacterized protein L969DRAFT_93211 [Mixia osmundae IAM 14324]|uniref:SRR1-like domain-containing protein n=1 Tax=Mixia osmundae (strain CBS 9802 / IAM 14324 / JCM 22182 / KY 12970) TaxID=764103 RepID=G7E5S1_MIXOS|nr:uncharacterized protein L969DRAFT_93211 [Mixia osmundae IAM 14324]KEI40669.1 hypothetical protein L969DRAFT_93211 [Mixia osmundae IAM 14324]GAA98181.1 hypothetical protein E5Q_04864 [Mixia osmundae IAM 14324]
MGDDVDEEAPWKIVTGRTANHKKRNKSIRRPAARPKASDGRDDALSHELSGQETAACIAARRTHLNAQDYLKIFREWLLETLQRAGKSDRDYVLTCLGIGRFSPARDYTGSLSAMRSAQCQFVVLQELVTLLRPTWPVRVVDPALGSSDLRYIESLGWEASTDLQEHLNPRYCCHPPGDAHTSNPVHFVYMPHCPRLLHDTWLGHFADQGLLERSLWLCNDLAHYLDGTAKDKSVIPRLCALVPSLQSSPQPTAPKYETTAFSDTRLHWTKELGLSSLAKSQACLCMTPALVWLWLALILLRAVLAARTRSHAPAIAVDDHATGLLVSYSSIAAIHEEWPAIVPRAASGHKQHSTPKSCESTALANAAKVAHRYGYDPQPTDFELFIEASALCSRVGFMIIDDNSQASVVMTMSPGNLENDFQPSVKFSFAEGLWRAYVDETWSDGSTDYNLARVVVGWKTTTWQAMFAPAHEAALGHCCAGYLDFTVMLSYGQGQCGYVSAQAQSFCKIKQPNCHSGAHGWPPTHQSCLQTGARVTYFSLSSSPASIANSVAWWTELLNDLNRHGFLSRSTSAAQARPSTSSEKGKEPAKPSGDTILLQVDDTLLDKLRWDGVGRPLALHYALERMLKEGKLMSLASFNSSKGRMPSDSASQHEPGLSLLSRTFAWSLQTLGFSSSDEQDVGSSSKSREQRWAALRGTYILVDSARTALAGLRTAAQDASAGSPIDCLYTRDDFYHRFSLEGQEQSLSRSDMDIMLLSLQSSNVLVYDDKMVKVISRQEADKVMISDTDRGILQVKMTRIALQRQIDDLENRIKEAQDKASEYVASKRKELAMSYLRTKKDLTALLDKRTRSLETIQAVLLKIETAAGDIDIVRAYETATASLQSLLKNPSLAQDHVEQTMSNLQDTLADQSEIEATVLQGTEDVRLAAGQGTVDEDDLAKELESLALEEQTSAVTEPSKAESAPTKGVTAVERADAAHVREEAAQDRVPLPAE